MYTHYIHILIQQNILHLILCYALNKGKSKGALIDLAKSGAIANFPVSPAQLRTHWHENVPHILGTFSKPSVRNFPRLRGEPGDIVSTDRLGPISPVTIGKHDGIHVFIDYATLYLMIILSKSQTSKDLANIMETVSKSMHCIITELD